MTDGQTNQDQMYLYVELWNAKPSWLALPAADRQAFMAKVDAFLSELEKGGLEIDGCALNDGDTTPRIPYRYMAIWKTKDKAMIKQVADGTAKLGWYEYFDQVNVGGFDVGAEGLIGEILGL